MGGKMQRHSKRHSRRKAIFAVFIAIFHASFIFLDIYFIRQLEESNPRSKVSPPVEESTNYKDWPPVELVDRVLDHTVTVTASSALLSNNRRLILTVANSDYVDFAALATASATTTDWSIVSERLWQLI